MSDEYLVLEYPADNKKGYCTLTELKGFENNWAVGAGISQVDTPPGQITMSMHAERPRNTALPDYVNNLHSLMIISPRLKKFLQEQNVTHVEYFPLDIIDHKGKIASNEYVIAHLIDHIECIDADASEAKWTNEGLPTLRIRSLESMELETSKIPEGRNLFFPKYYSVYPILHKDLAEAMEKEGFTNIDIVPLDECAC